MARIINNLKSIINKCWIVNAQLPQIRNASYQSSVFLEDIDKITTRYNISKDLEEWKYVERILPVDVVPEPIKKDRYPSGWKPQGDNLANQPYFIARTKNHMMPVYLELRQRGVKRFTVVSKIQGDIWQFEKDIRPFLENFVAPRPLRLQVDEFSRKICINGDHVNSIKHWLGERNY